MIREEINELLEFTVIRPLKHTWATETLTSGRRTKKEIFVYWRHLNSSIVVYSGSSVDIQTIFHGPKRTEGFTQTDLRQSSIGFPSRNELIGTRRHSEMESATSLILTVSVSA